eukprot:comp23259_c1_seq1/m.38013 comp23259_c1_seq1/g.38013  ORF comp23259_c1_seq1/g.38013 comp23259_c1_seq1/m.38013 type:complete len:240 (-) comp23259_c1_seq1:103-822(-)
MTFTVREIQPTLRVGSASKLRIRDEEFTDVQIDKAPSQRSLTEQVKRQRPGILKIGHTHATPKKAFGVRFNTQAPIKLTHSPEDYPRGEPKVHLTDEDKHYIRSELIYYKLNEMESHPDSRVNLNLHNRAKVIRHSNNVLRPELVQDAQPPSPVVGGRHHPQIRPMPVQVTQVTHVVMNPSPAVMISDQSMKDSGKAGMMGGAAPPMRARLAALQRSAPWISQFLSMGSNGERRNSASV